MISAVKLGSGRFTYQVDADWEKLPAGYSWSDAAAVATDSKDNVYVFNRGDHPMIVFDSEGNFLSSWGEGVFNRAHGITLGPDDTLYCTDDGDHTVRQCTLDGKVLMTIGVPGQVAAAYSGEPFNRCTHVAIDPNSGELYVSDGYGNARVHKFSSDGKHLFSWGAPGMEPGEFNIVHNIATDKDGYVYVADRESHRVQIFNAKGEYQTQWNNVHRPCAIYISKDQLVYVGELGAAGPVNENHPNIGPRVSVMTTKGERLAALGHGFGGEVGQMMAPHGICLDSKDSIYLGEVAYTNLRNQGKDPEGVRSFQKFVKAE